MQTIPLQHDITEEQYQMAVRLLATINIKAKEIKAKKMPVTSDTKMSKADFYAMIDEASKGPFYKDSPELRRELFGIGCVGQSLGGNYA